MHGHAALLSTPPLLAAGLAALLSLAAPQPAAAQKDDTLVVGLTEDIRGADPRRERDGLLDDVHVAVVEGLVGYRDDLEVAPVLAEKVEMRDGGRTFAFTLREGVKFHNGAPLTSAEVKWSWDYLMSPDSLWRCRPVFSGQAMTVTSVETPDPRTVVFTLDKPNGSFLYNMARLDCAQTPILHPASLNADGSWNKPVGTGPFVFVERKVGQSAEIRRFADYAARDDAPSGMTGRKEARVGTVRFLLVKDPNARTVALRSGDIDLTRIPWHTAKDLEGDPRIRIVRSESTAWYALLLNVNDPLLRDKRLRQAIAAAIDRDAVAQAVSAGMWQGTTTPMPRLSRFYAPLADARTGHDLEAAKRLLKEAGYAGQPITLMANKSFELMGDQAILIQGMLQAAGINARIEMVEWAYQLDRYMKADYQAQSFGYSGRYDPMGAWERIVGPESRKIWKDPEAIALLREGTEATDPAAIQDISNRLHRKFLDEVPGVSLYHVGIATGASRRVEGLTPSPIEAFRVWNLGIGK